MSMQISGLAFDPATHPRRSTRVAFGEALMELAERDLRIVALAADSARLCCTWDFNEKHPDRGFNIGIAEQNLIGMAAGMASCGLIPFACSYAPFLQSRAIEQIRNDCAYTKLPVKIMATAAGIQMGTAGSTHHATEDLAILRSIANMTVVVPADAHATYKLTFKVAEWPGPVWLRTGRDPEFVVYTDGRDFEIGKAVVLREGRDATIIACGNLVLHALLAADLLAQEGLRIGVIDMHTIKPLDREAVLKAARETGRIVTAEEHNVIGGLGGAVAEVLAQEQPTPMRMIGLNDIFASIGPTYDLMKKYGLTYEGVADTVRKFVRG
ncbi:MAG: transketolase family protein [Bacteroidetes bacterium]|nr:transketolase family protein [Bacteroidota bacterium]MCL5026882.1 transketolase family protein [Chloroflexota bacterium]